LSKKGRVGQYYWVKKISLISRIQEKIVKNIFLKYFRKITKKEQFTKLYLGVKPPLQKSTFRRMVKFWKKGILMGG
jgi:hypothetical protein